jgi:hypothetical protein
MPSSGRFRLAAFEPAAVELVLGPSHPEPDFAPAGASPKGAAKKEHTNREVEQPELAKSEVRRGQQAECGAGPRTGA